jgi:isopenicillin N synthase-like dioxygenase
MARWTNDRWVSTLHRVNGAGPDAVTPRRQSIAYFMNPDYDAEIRTLPTCLDSAGRSRYDPVLAGDYLMKKFRAAL